MEAEVHAMGAGATRGMFLLVAALAVGAAAFRVSTAPERIQERRNTARSVCVAGGGEWVKVDNNEICRKDAAAIKP